MNEHLTVALDSDGVLAHFEQKVCEINGVDCMSKVSRGRVWSSIGHFDKTVMPFFESLDKMDDADRLVEFVRANFINHFILTACGYTPKDGAEQKKRWYAKHYGPEMVVKVVTGSRDKATFASPTTILVDDREKSIGPWVEAGGIGILHRSADETIARLKEIIDEHR